MAYTLKILDKGNEPIVKNTLGKNLIGGLAKGIENAEDYLRLGAGAISDPLGIKSVKYAINTLYPQEQQQEKVAGFRKLISPLIPEPKTIPEKESEDVIGNVAFNLATLGAEQGFKSVKDFGMAGFDFLKRSLQGKAGKYAAKAVGFGDIGQAIVEVGTPVALETLNVNNLVKGMQKPKENAYEEATKAAGFKKVNSRVEAGDTKEKLTNYLLRDYAEQPGLKNFKKNIQSMYGTLDKNGDIYIKDALHWKQELNNLVYRSDISQTLKDKYSSLLPNFNGILEKASSEFKDFGSPYNQANNLTRIVSEAKQASEFAKEAFDKVKVTQPIKYLFSGTKLIGSQAGNALGTAAQLKIDHPKQFAEYYSKAIAAASKKQLPKFLSNVKNMEKLVKTKDKEKSYNKSGFTLNIIE
jgi:hypothetical protein